ncbi:GPI inositol-deacylase isoform X2 [Epargyreus clarus]
MQARSLASVALRKAVSKGYEYHFDYFTISYSEEYSGLYGGVLQRQTQFAAACISRILSLYKSNKYTKSVPTSVIVIGHSMGGLVAKRLMAYPTTLKTTNVVITLAAPLQGPVLNFDTQFNEYYAIMRWEWQFFLNNSKEIKDKKILISIGSGPRDVLMPAGLTASNDSYINALVTAIPGVWVSPDHVSMVWCKQLVMVINRYLFDIVDPNTEQITQNRAELTAKAKQYFQANRSMTLDPKIIRPEVPMIVDAFWYEDNRRIYQISRPTIDRTIYLMIRLVSFPQNRFVAIEAINVDDKDWIFGCNAMYSNSIHRYCKHATSLGELSRWLGAAKTFGRRKLATIHLHNLIEQHPDWTHVIVKVSPTRKPIVLNVDINDHASREIKVNLPSILSFNKQVIKQETEANSLYYELLLPGFDVLHQAYLLYVEPTANCQSEYHVTAEMHVPWAKNHEYFHYFTHLQRSAMKLRLYKSNPKVILGLDPTEYVKVTILLDPMCTFKISISNSWYHRLAQFARHYTPILLPYVAAIVLLAARTNILNLKSGSGCVSIHSALMSESVKPYYVLVFARLVAVAMSASFLNMKFHIITWDNDEFKYFTNSLLVLPAFMIALGIVNVSAAVVLAIMVFSSQLAHRLLFRIMWRGGSGVAERVASGLQRLPLAVTAAMLFASQLACGAAALTMGAAFYAYLISKMYEEYLEDYVYKLMAKVASRICRIFKSKKNENKVKSTTCLALQEDSGESSTSESVKVVDKDTKVGETKNITNGKSKKDRSKREKIDNSKALVKKQGSCEAKEKSGEPNETDKQNQPTDVDVALNDLNFHMTMFFMWMTVTIINIPALLTWARNFQYSIVLRPDTSYNPGFLMSVCSALIWQKEILGAPRTNLKYYDVVDTLLFFMATFIIVLGPISMSLVNYAVTFMFVTITFQQMFDKCNEDNSAEVKEQPACEVKSDKGNESEETKDKEDCVSDDDNDKRQDDNDECKPEESESSPLVEDNCDVCDESRIYNVFKNLKEKFSFNNDV